MTEPPTPQPLFLPAEPDPAFATLHPAAAGATGAAVLILPPFGWDEICSYRGLRFWAEQLAGAGHPALRLTLPGTGDSGGHPRDPDRLGAWLAAVSGAAAWLRETTGAERLVALGIGLGGLLACRAASDGAEIDDLVLWGTPARGRTLLRGLRAFSHLEHAELYAGVSDPPPVTEGEIESGGFVLTAETMTALERVDLATLSLPAARQRRVLLLDRDGLAADRDLRGWLEGAGAAVTVAPGPGFGELTSHPQFAAPPLGVIARVGAWLAESSQPASLGMGATVQPSGGPGVELRVSGEGDGDGGVIRETALAIPHAGGQLAGVLSEPLEATGRTPAVILVNAGAVRRVGPNRMWVEAARRWAATGVPVLRLDMEAIGDSDGDEVPYRSDAALYTSRFVPHVARAMDALQARGVAEEFVVGGLCSGAYWALHAALQDRRVCGLLLVNPRVLIWTAGLGASRDLRVLLTERPSLTRIRKVATGPRLRSLARWTATAPLRAARPSRSRDVQLTARRLDAEIDELVASGCRIAWVFADREPLQAELTRTGRLDELLASPNVTLERIHVRDHTMRPLWAQRELHAALDRALTREPGVLELVGAARCQA